MYREPIIRRKSSTFSRAIALAFVLLIVSPVTAPFQAVSLRELAGTRSDAHVPALLAPARSRNSSPRDSIVSILPPASGTDGRVKLRLHATADAREASRRQPAVHDDALCLDVDPQQRTFLVLRV
jgi:hypothetical protein